MRDLKKRHFYLNIRNFFIFKYFYLKVQLDTRKTMLLKIKINTMMNFQKKVVIWTYECFIFRKKQRNIHYWLCMKNKNIVMLLFYKKYFME